MSDKVLSFEGYVGTVEFSLEDDRLFGKVLHINDLVSYEGKSLGELRAAFEGAVKEYLETCTRHNRDPNKPFGGTFNVRIGAELHREAAIYSACHGISLNELITDAIKEKVAENKQKVEIHHHHAYTESVTYEATLSEDFSSLAENETATWRQHVKH